MRSNVDVWVSKPSQRIRWMVFTPDTYRIGYSRARYPAPPGWTTIGSDAEAPLAAWESGTPVVVTQSTKPAMPGSRRITEPALTPKSVSFPPAADIPDSDDLVGIVRNFNSAGSRFQAVLAGQYTAAASQPNRPITGDAVVVVSAVPLHDVGGGSRGAQLAGALLKKGIAVAYVSAFGVQETDDLGLRYQHELLEQWALPDFDVAQYATRVDGKLVALVSVPSTAAAELAQAVSQAGGTVIYDLIDNWDDPGLGGDWFDSIAEVLLMRTADHVIASAADLVDRVQTRAARPAILVPNGVNEDLFGHPGQREPDDWPGRGNPTIGYHGSLYGSWLDWDAITRVANSYPQALLIMIGDPKGVPADLPSNIRLLGLKPQHELLGYVERFDIGLLPFLTNETTHAVSPLKVYEYLAAGVPVAAPPLRALSKLDGVYMDEDLAAAVRTAAEAEAPDGAAALAKHGWAGRVSTIIDLAGLTPGQGEPVITTTTRATHHARRDRRI